MSSSLLSLSSVSVKLSCLIVSMVGSLVVNVFSARVLDISERRVLTRQHRGFCRRYRRC
jgi:hypothetical protein